MSRNRNNKNYKKNVNNQRKNQNGHQHALKSHYNLYYEPTIKSLRKISWYEPSTFNLSHHDFNAINFPELMHHRRTTVEKVLYFLILQLMKLMLEHKIPLRSCLFE